MQTIIGPSFFQITKNDLLRKKGRAQNFRRGLVG
jgi:hypothetical protein